MLFHLRWMKVLWCDSRFLQLFLWLFLWLQWLDFTMKTTQKCHCWNCATSSPQVHFERAFGVIDFDTFANNVQGACEIAFEMVIASISMYWADNIHWQSALAELLSSQQCWIGFVKRNELLDFDFQLKSVIASMMASAPSELLRMR